MHVGRPERARLYSTTEGELFAPAAIDVLERAGRVRVPARILWARDGIFPYAHHENLASRMARAELRVADTGYLVPMENPELGGARGLALRSELMRGGIKLDASGVGEVAFCPLPP